MREDLFPRPAINQLPGATKTGGSRRALGEVVECPCWAVKGENLSGSTMADCRWDAQGASTTAAWAERPAAAPTPGRAGPRRSCRRCLPALMPAPGSKVCLAAASNESHSPPQETEIGTWTTMYSIRRWRLHVSRSASSFWRPPCARPTITKNTAVTPRRIPSQPSCHKPPSGDAVLYTAQKRSGHSSARFATIREGGKTATRRGPRILLGP